jgi:hypothetical protein
MFVVETTLRLVRWRYATWPIDTQYVVEFVFLAVGRQEEEVTFVIANNKNE